MSWEQWMSSSVAAALQRLWAASQHAPEGAPKVRWMARPASGRAALLAMARQNLIPAQP